MKRNPTIILALAAITLAAAPLRAQVDHPPPDAPAAPSPARPAIFELSQVEIQPELVNRREVGGLISRHYPREQRRRRETGTVVLRFVVTREGTVDSTTITPENATDMVFVEGAVEVVRGMRFRPARFDGHPVDVWVTLPVAFWTEGAPPPPTWVPGSRPR